MNTFTIGMAQLGLLLMLAGLAVSAPATLSTSSYNNSLLAYHCNSSPTWGSFSFFPKDCHTAIGHFMVEELIPHGMTPFEFVTNEHSRSTYLPHRVLPQKYHYGLLPGSFIRQLSVYLPLQGTCTIAIASLSTFSPDEIPGIEPQNPFPESDVSSYGEIWTAVKDITNNCISPYLYSRADSVPGNLTFVSDTGWSAVGM